MGHDKSNTEEFLGPASPGPAGEEPRGDAALPTNGGEFEDSAAALDRALDGLHRTSPYYGGLLANHGPMVAEALESMGQGHRIDAFVTHYGAKLQPFVPEPAGEHPPGLGDGPAVARWIAHYQRELGRRGVAEVLAEAVPRLLPGAMAGATHGLIRTAHAVRGWKRVPNPPRLREIAFGLGYWAAAFQPLPGVVGSRVERGLTVERALEQMPGVSESEQRTGLIFERVRALDDQAWFAEQVARVDLRGVDLDDFVSRMTSIAARWYLTAPQAGFTYLHVFTSVNALRSLAGYLPGASVGAAIDAAYHCAAALYAAHGADKRWLSYAPTLAGRGAESLADRAAATFADHAIKLAAAALHEHRLHPRPEYLEAAYAEVEQAESAR